MDGVPWILLLDDGELDDVRAVIEEMGLDFDQWNKSDLIASPPHPERLLVTTAALAIGARLRRTTTRTRDRAVWIAVATGHSKSQRSAILGAGFDYLVRRPIHPEAFSSLLQGVLYQGHEQRQKRRVAVGYTISIRVDQRKRAIDALLMDLSPGGCRLLTRAALRPGSELELTFPTELTGGGSFRHCGTVTRAGAGSTAGGEADEYCAGVRFQPFDGRSRKSMLDLLNTLTAGPPVIPRKSRAAATAPALPPRAPRAVYDREVAIFGLEDCVLIGRDLSPGGLRVDPHPALTIGSALRLALAGPGGEQQILVDARVIRDDGEDGVALRFDWIDPASEQHLRSLVDGLPAIETATDDPKQPSGIVFASFIPKILRRSQR